MFTWNRFFVLPYSPWNFVCMYPSVHCSFLSIFKNCTFSGKFLFVELISILSLNFCSASLLTLIFFCDGPPITRRQFVWYPWVVEIVRRRYSQPELWNMVDEATSRIGEFYFLSCIPTGSLLMRIFLGSRSILNTLPIWYGPSNYQTWHLWYCLSW